jgi:hypothetical protein
MKFTTGLSKTSNTASQLIKDRKALGMLFKVSGVQNKPSHFRCLPFLLRNIIIDFVYRDRILHQLREISLTRDPLLQIRTTRKLSF